MPDDKTTSGSEPSGLLRFLPTALLTLIVVAFAIDNRRNVTVGFVFADAKVPLVLVLLATAVVGALIGALLRRRRH